MTRIDRTQGSRLRRLFFALAVLYVLPFWIVPYLPTTDGPCHTYNAWVLRQYGNTAQYPLFQQYYEINWRPFPNWIGHGTMALLMFILPPLIAEKVLVSGYVLLFLGGAWYLAGAVRPAERWPAFLAFPFAYHQLFQNGFYNFSISLALFLFILGLWWRHRARPGLAFAVKINLLLWLCYFSHILSFMLAIAAIGVFWLATLRRESWRRHAVHIAILLPQIPLPLWFFHAQGTGSVPAENPFLRRLQYFTRLESLATFSAAQLWWTAALAVVFLLLLLLTLRGKVRRPLVEEADVFLLLSLACVFLFFAGPEGMSGGSLIQQRLSLYPYLLLIPWLAPRFGGNLRRIAAGTLAVAALVNLGSLLRWYWFWGGEMEHYLSALSAVSPNTRVYALHYQRTGPTDALSHTMGYKALEKGLIDWDNYEAKLPYFQTRFRSSVTFPPLPGGPLAPDSFRPRSSRHLVDAVYTWQMPDGASLRSRLPRQYERVAADFGGELWELRRAGVESRHGGIAERDRPGERRQSRNRPRGLPATGGSGLQRDDGKPGPGQRRGRGPRSAG